MKRYRGYDIGIFFTQQTAPHSAPRSSRRPLEPVASSSAPGRTYWGGCCGNPKSTPSRRSNQSSPPDKQVAQAWTTITRPAHPTAPDTTLQVSKPLQQGPLAMVHSRDCRLASTPTESGTAPTESPHSHRGDKGTSLGPRHTRRQPAQALAHVLERPRVGSLDRVRHRRADSVGTLIQQLGRDGHRDGSLLASEHHLYHPLPGRRLNLRLHTAYQRETQRSSNADSPARASVGRPLKSTNADRQAFPRCTLRMQNSVASDERGVE